MIVDWEYFHLDGFVTYKFIAGFYGEKNISSSALPLSLFYNLLCAVVQNNTSEGAGFARV